MMCETCSRSDSVHSAAGESHNRNWFHARPGRVDWCAVVVSDQNPFGKLLTLFMTVGYDK